MDKINTNTLTEYTWCSPKGKFAGGGKQVSEALGRKPQSMDLRERHPFDVEILRVSPGKTRDAFIFPPGQPHQIINDSSEDLIVYVIADNPFGESSYYPDSQKWMVRSPEVRLIRSDKLDDYDGEE